MVTALLHAFLGLWIQAAPDPTGAYAAVLTEVRQLAPERQVVLATTLSRPECSPHCGDSVRAVSHPADVVNALRERGLIHSTCTPAPGSIDCGSGREVWAADRMVVTLGPVERGETGEVEVSAMVHWRFEYRGRGLSSLQGHRYRLRCDEGRWRVVSSTLVWTA